MFAALAPLQPRRFDSLAAGSVSAQHADDASFTSVPGEATRWPLRAQLDPISALFDLTARPPLDPTPLVAAPAQEPPQWTRLFRYRPRMHRGGGGHGGQVGLRCGSTTSWTPGQAHGESAGHMLLSPRAALRPRATPRCAPHVRGRKGLVAMDAPRPLALMPYVGNLWWGKVYRWSPTGNLEHRGRSSMGRVAPDVSGTCRTPLGFG